MFYNIGIVYSRSHVGLVLTSNTAKVDVSGVRISARRFLFFINRHTNCRERFIAWVSTIQREKTREGAEFVSRDEGTYRGGEAGEKPAQWLSDQHPVSALLLLRLRREKEKKKGANMTKSAKMNKKHK